VDGVEASSEVVSELQSEGGLVLGYVSAGTIERGRPWTKRLRKRFSIGYWPDWDEWFAAVRKARFRRYFLNKIAAPVLEKGFDGLFLDNVDMIAIRRRQTKGMIKLLEGTRELLGERFLFIQNGDEIIPTIEAQVRFDGWNREDVTSTYDFDSKSYSLNGQKQIQAALSFVAEMVSKGYLVTTADYVASSDSSEAVLSIENSCSVGAVPFVGDIFLTQVTEAVPLC
ncbi:MAG: endo alpha-1,4 polygalactosaminidase, partial [Bdellovibrionales bacterium]|nr:endo alpha-1,4 polygalactosaminidase [Bdellovibrionales bacterium]